MKNQERDFTSRAKLSTIGRLDCKIFGSMLQHCVMTKSNKFSHPTHPMACSPHKLIFFYVFYLKSTWGFTLSYDNKILSTAFSGIS